MLGGALLFSLTMSLTSCEDVLGHWEKPTPTPITPPSGGETPVTPEEIYAFSLCNMADADITATAFNVTDQDGNTIVTAESDGKYTIKSGELSSVTTLWLEATTATGKYIAKATKEELPTIAEAGKLKMATLGDVILADGTFAARLSTTGTKVAMIAYLGSETGVPGYTHGLALALTDVGQGTWEAAKTVCSTTTPVTGATWLLASQDQWDNMISACKNVLGNKNTYEDLRDGFSGIAGASNLEPLSYWSSTEKDADNAWQYNFNDTSWGWDGYIKSNAYRKVRACLAF